MTIKRRIFLSNTIMVLFSLIVLLVIGGNLIKHFKEEYLEENSQYAQLSENVYDVYNIMDKLQSYKGNWNELNDELSKYDFNLCVRKSCGKKVYANINHRQRECMEELKHLQFKEGKVFVYYTENVTVVKSSIEINGEKLNVFALSSKNEKYFFGMNKGFFEAFIVLFIVIGIGAIIILMFITQLVTKYLVKRILYPVNKLTEAAQRIDNGNLDEMIDYSIQDEFQEVCEVFDKMQKHLKEGINKNALYEKARTDMISGISHDLRTPLTSVKGYIKGMKDGVANTPEKQEQYLNIAYKKACDMEKLLEKLFFFSKLETGNMPFYEEHIELGKFIKQYINDISTDLKNKDIDIYFKNDDKLHMVLIDVEQFTRVLNNIIENSIKYSKEKNLVIHIKISKSVDKEQIQISDNGEGVPEEKLPYLFEQFYRGDESRNSKNDGNGLGLYICKYIIEKHGGNISASNDNGMCIVIELPQDKE